MNVEQFSLGLVIVSAIAWVFGGYLMIAFMDFSDGIPGAGLLLQRIAIVVGVISFMVMAGTILGIHIEVG